MFYTTSVKVLSVMDEIFFFILYVLVSNWSKLSFRVLLFVILSLMLESVSPGTDVVQ